MSRTEAFVQDDWMRDGVKIAVRITRAEGYREMVRWGDVAVSRIAEETAAMPPEDAFLRMPDGSRRSMGSFMAGLARRQVPDERVDANPLGLVVATKRGGVHDVAAEVPRQRLVHGACHVDGLGLYPYPSKADEA
jgi:hypothetical protein